MTNPQPVPAGTGPSDGGRDILAILLIALAAGVALIVGLVLVLVAFAPKPTESFSYDFPEAECGQPCLGLDNVRVAAGTAAEVAALGAALGPVDSSVSSVEDWEAEATEDFYLAGGSPQACVFAISRAPIAPQSQSTGYYDESVLDVLSATGAVTVTQVARLSDRGLDSGRYPGMIRGALNRCPSYTVEKDDGTVEEVDVTPLPIDLDIPGVETVAWTENRPSDVSVVIDLHYANVAVRTEATGSSIDVAALTELARATAERLVVLGE
ncbi:hypothetical protein [Antiquaquibacter soli]|uniref:DUF3558 domain-containing protein n=1 Tax=Antiquaquibacter soli TaxID=3064523 RepID=A0ABT9BL10_9MICO|nr:hypothetical protein [Protaetiibacter sp. WY-16]MDO7881684.1 hypothetical protein [Protaetiibacter sp. WY-16]